MKRPLFIAIMGFLLFFNERVKAQEVNPINIPSPQVYNMIKYGNTPVSLYNGELDLEIPLYEYQDKDFSLPVSIKYNSQGFIPNQRDGIIGLNWNLLTGGVIYRRVNGSPDEYSLTLDDRILGGTYYAIEANKGIKNLTKEFIFSLPENKIKRNFFWNINNCEIKPDEFSFSMPGHSGKFFLQNNGEVKCLGKDYDVELHFYTFDPLNKQYYFDNFSEIIITTDDGYKYYFGGDRSRWEMSFPLSDPIDGGGANEEKGLAIINAWNLYKIVAPNGRNVVYSYRPMGTDIYDVSGDEEFYLLHASKNLYSTGSYENGGSCFLCGQASTSLAREDNYREITKTNYLEKIKIDDSEINFHYSPKDISFYPSLNFETDFNTIDLKLDSVTVNKVNQDNNYKKFEFVFNRIGNGAKKPLALTSLIEDGKQPYIFEYYDQDYFPDPNTNGVDHWGFWNGKENQGLIPDITVSQNGDFTYSSTDRSTDGTYCKVGMLKKVHYPTGYSEYFYEPHDYSNRLEKRNVSNFNPQLFPETGIAGGARISKIIDNDGKSYFNVRELKYQKDYPSSTSSGILMKWPRYVENLIYGSEEPPSYMYRISSNNFTVNSHPGEKYIHYSEVTEITSGNGIITTKFNSYDNMPDIDDVTTVQVLLDYYKTTEQHMLSWSSKGLLFNNKSFARGSVNEVLYYEEDKVKPIKKTKYYYTQFNDFPDQYLVSVSNSEYYARANKIYYYPFLPKQIRDTIFNVNGSTPVARITGYTYDSNGNLKEKEVMGSKNETLKDVNYYPNDYVEAGESYFETLITKNIIGKPIDVRTYNNSKLTSGIQTKYNNFGQPIETYNFESTANDIAFNATTPFTFTQKQTISYNVDKNPEKLDIVDNLKTYYLWAYNKQYPIAKIESNSVFAISNIQSAINVLDLSGSNVKTQIDTDILNIKNAISTDVILANTVTIYTYKPLVGMTSQTDPAGRTTYYEYDDFGRLKLVRDQNGNIVSKNEYHYAGQ